MSRKWEGSPGLALATLVAGVFALILLIIVSSPVMAGSGSGDAALGDATVTLRATSGSIVHTLDLPISVADQLPSC